MSEVFTVITPTGDRPLAFELSRKWMEHQTIKPIRWIIVDDGQVPMVLDNPKEYEFYIRRTPVSQDPKHTLTINIKEALPFIVGEKVAFWEDDEYYAPTYLENMILKLDSYSMAGIGCAKYYHLPTGGYVIHGNMKHCSLAETAFHISILPMIQKFVDRGMEIDWLDCNIWKAMGRDRCNKSLIFKDNEKTLFVGMKGMPGRFGIGIGHRTNSYKIHDDKNRSKLKEWVPEDYQTYLDILLDIK